MPSNPALRWACYWRGLGACARLVASRRLARLLFGLPACYSACPPAMQSPCQNRRVRGQQSVASSQAGMAISHSATVRGASTPRAAEPAVRASRKFHPSQRSKHFAARVARTARDYGTARDHHWAASPSLAGIAGRKFPVWRGTSALDVAARTALRRGPCSYPSRSTDPTRVGAWGLTPYESALAERSESSRIASHGCGVVSHEPSGAQVRSLTKMGNTGCVLAPRPGMGVVANPCRSLGRGLGGEGDERAREQPLAAKR
jgi:hypothetical protein